MNDGFFALTIGSIFLFLLLGDWFGEELAGRSWKTGTVCLVLLLVMASPFLAAELSGTRVTLAMFLLPSLSFGFMCGQTKQEAIHLMAASLLVGSVYVLLQELFRMDPVFLLTDPRIMSGGVIGLLTGLFALSLPGKWMTAFFGFPAGWLFFHLFDPERLPRAELGSFSHLDELFVALLSLSVLHLFLQMLRRARRFSLRGRKKGTRQRGVCS